MNAFLLRRHFFTASLLLLFLPSFSQAATRNVPSQYPTMQAAINAAAVSGDTVLVADGTYTGSGNRDLDFLGKSLTVRSVNGAARTVIDCQGTSAAPHRGFYIHQNEADVAISGFTVKNGYAANASGGGAFIHSNVSATITNCIFSTNKVTGSPDSGVGGGGLFVNGGTQSVTVANCTFSSNYANNGGGGAIIFCDSDTGNTSVTNCTFSGNYASSGAGGGAGFNGNNVTLTNCTFSGNQAVSGSNGGGGGGAFAYATSNATVTNCAFSGNAATGNAASSAIGGGAFVFGDTATVTNCTFSGNAVSKSNGGGGAYVASDSSSKIVNCTFSGNAVNGTAAEGPTGGGGAIIYSSGSETVTNCIAWDDTAPTGKEIYLYTDDAMSVSLTFSDIQGGAASAVPSSGSFTYTNNLNADPKFVDADAGDLHLQPISPCIGMGTPNGAPTTDKDGNTRSNPPSMGAYDVAFTLQSLTLSPPSVYGGQTSTGTVTLTRPAPAGGTSVTLSSNTGYATVPTSVTIAAGQSQQTFVVHSNPVATSKAATLTARLGGATQTATLLIYPPALKTFTLSPSTLPSGSQTTATVTLTSPAPAGGVSVPIMSGTATLGTVAIAAGATTGTLTLTTGPAGTYTLTATFGGVQKSAQLTVTSNAALSSVSLNPGSVYGGQSATGTVHLSSPAPAGGVRVTLASNTGYAIVPVSVTVAAGQSSQTFTVTTSAVPAFKGVTITASASGVSKTASLLIYPPALQYLTLSPTSVKGGQQNSAGTVTLTSAAPAGGTVVTLSSNTGYASVPGSVTVAAGSRTATFTVTTRPVTSNKGATITAAQGGVSKSIGLLLTP